MHETQNRDYFDVEQIKYLTSKIQKTVLFVQRSFVCTTFITFLYRDALPYTRWWCYMICNYCCDNVSSWCCYYGSTQGGADAFVKKSKKICILGNLEYTVEVQKRLITFELDIVPMVCRGVVIHRAVSRNGISSRKPPLGVRETLSFGGLFAYYETMRLQPTPTDWINNENLSTLDKMVFLYMWGMTRNSDGRIQFYNGKQKVDFVITRGQTFVQISQVSKALRMNKKTVRQIIENIKKWYFNMDITRKPSWLLITRVWYDDVIKMDNTTDITTDITLDIVGISRNKSDKSDKSDKRGKPPQHFLPPTLDLVQAYCEERANWIDAEAFIASYAASWWKMKNGRQVKDRKSCVITREKRKKQRDKEREPKSMQEFAELYDKIGVQEFTKRYGVDKARDTVLYKF